MPARQQRLFACGEAIRFRQTWQSRLLAIELAEKAKWRETSVAGSTNQTEEGKMLSPYSLSTFEWTLLFEKFLHLKNISNFKQFYFIFSIISKC